MQNHNDGCIVAVTQGVACPKQVDLVDYLAFHFGAFKNFSTATRNDIVTLSLIFSLFVAIEVTLSTLWGNLILPKLAYRRSKRLDRFDLNLSSRHRLTRWLALHENSPAFL
ncbi:MAG TPA: hypothetical protein VJB69_02975 [Candidatus Paceibacterota bacterium]